MPSIKWYYNSRTGMVIQRLDSAMAFDLHTGQGWHGPFDSKQAAFDYYNANKAKNIGWRKPLDLPELPGTTTPSLPDTPEVKDFIGGLDLGNWFIRIGEILLGLILVGVGVAKLTGTTNAIASAVKAKL